MNYSGKRLIPILSIWVFPRATIRQIVEMHPWRGFIAISVMYGFLSILEEMTRPNTFATGMRASITFALVAGPAFGLLICAATAFAFRMSYSMLGGYGDFTKSCAALAWGIFPPLIASPLLIAMISIFGPEMFPIVQGVSSPAAVIAYLGYTLFKLALAIWALAILIAAMSEVESLSISRTIAGCGLAFCMIFVALLVVRDTLT